MALSPPPTQSRVASRSPIAAATERGVEWVGGSRDRRRRSVALRAGPPDDRASPSTVLADVDLDEARDKRWGDRNDVIGDRRDDVYESPLTPRHAGDVY